MAIETYWSQTLKRRVTVGADERTPVGAQTIVTRNMNRDYDCDYCGGRRAMWTLCRCDCAVTVGVDHACDLCVSAARQS